MTSKKTQIRAYALYVAVALTATVATLIVAPILIANGSRRASSLSGGRGAAQSESASFVMQQPACSLGGPRRAASPITGARLVQVHVVHRHCERAPFAAVDLPGIPASVWPQQMGVNIGDLTSLGLKRCMDLGTSLGQHYMPQIAMRLPYRAYTDDAGQNFGNNTVVRTFGCEPANPIDGVDVDGLNSTQHYFSSSNADRTQQSAAAVAAGLFGVSAPLGVQLAAVNRSSPATIDNLNGAQTCRVAMGMAFTTLNADLTALNARAQPVLQRLAALVGLPANGTYTSGVLGFLPLADTVLNLLPTGLLGASDELRATLPYVWDVIDQFFTVTSSRAAVGSLGAAYFFQNMLGAMNAAVAQRKAGRDAYQRFMEYATHDTAMAPMLGMLGLLDAHPELRREPRYGSQIIFELYELAESTPQQPSYAVRIVVRDGPYDTFGRAYALDAPGCASQQCPLDAFAGVLQTHAMPADWCGPCRNTAQLECRLQSAYKSLGTPIVVHAAKPRSAAGDGAVAADRVVMADADAVMSRMRGMTA